MKHLRSGFSTLEIILIVFVVFVLGVVGAAAHRARLAKQTAPPPATSSATSQAPSSSPTTTNKGYFAVVLADLGKLGPLSSAVNQTCATNFPPPEPCQSNIQAYQQQLQGMQADLSQVTAPSSFAQADSSLRGALATDLQAVAQALDALQNHKLGEWLTALGNHNKAWQQLLTAKDQALSVSG